MSRESLKVAHRIYSRRVSRPSRRELLYTLYLSILVVWVFGVPIVRSGYNTASRPAVAEAFYTATAETAMQTAFGLLFAASVLAGRLRGPALLPPFLTYALAGNGMPRAITMRRAFIASGSVAASIIVVPTIVFAVAVNNSSGAGRTSAAIFVAVTVLCSIIAANLWLIGQILTTIRAVALATAIVVLTAVTAYVVDLRGYTVWGWASAHSPASQTLNWLPVHLLGLLTVGCLAYVPRLLDQLKGADMLDQAVRWQSAGTLGATGDLAGALGEFRAKPHLGRYWSALGNGSSMLITIVRRDVVGSMRTPGRAVAGIAGLLTSGWLLSLAFTVPDFMVWLVAALGAWLGFIAVGVCCDGFRHTMETTTRPTLYGTSLHRQLVQHSLLPIGCTLVVSTLAAGAAAWWFELSPYAILAAVSGQLFCVSVRLFDSAKGLLPPEVLAPAPTPFGDLSAIRVLWWQADALIIAVFLTGLTLMAAVAFTPMFLVMFPVGSCTMVFFALERAKQPT